METEPLWIVALFLLLFSKDGRDARTTYYIIFSGW